MDAKTQMQIVDDIALDITEKLGMLTKQGVLSVKDGINIIVTIHDKQLNWMESKFTPDEIYDFVYNY